MTNPFILGSRRSWVWPCKIGGSFSAAAQRYLSEPRWGSPQGCPVTPGHGVNVPCPPGSVGALAGAAGCPGQGEEEEGSSDVRATAQH